MPYVVQAVHPARGTKFRAELESRRAAIGTARDLHRIGFEVTVTTPDGQVMRPDEAGGQRLSSSSLAS